MAKDFAKAFYKSKAWQDARDYALMRDVYLCSRCGRLAEEVHHIIRLTPQNISDPAVTINPDNLECLCRECHQAEHANDRNGREPDFTDKYVFTADGLLVRRPPLQE